MARPRKEIDQKQFESLLHIGCGRNEIVAYFDEYLGGCSDDTVDRWCKRTYKLSFAEVLAKKRELFKISVRRAIAQALKDGTPSVIIFAAKNMLGWSDNPQESIDTEDADAYFAEAGLNENEDD